MKHFASPEFWEAFDRLPAEIQRKAREKHQLLKNDPHHPSLKLKKIDEFWSARIGIQYRALGIEEDGDILWFWIGHHRIYDELLK